MDIKQFVVSKFFHYGLFCVLGISSLYGENFPFDPPQNFIANPKYIYVHHPVSTNHVLAQLYFDQGLTFIYAFNHDAAYWSFLRASEADPNMAMAYWGMALALGSNINMEITEKRSQVAYQAIQKAIQLSSKSPESEQNYIKALAKRYSNDTNANAKDLAKDYSLAMKELSEKYPDDLDAAVLYSESLLDVNPWNQWTLDGKPMEGTLDAVRTLQSVLKRDPDNLGANHYYIHVLEASRHPEVALMSAERLKTLLPSSGHILHMPSHIYILTGDYQQAARSNEAAISADREYIREYGTDGIYPVHYLSHNLYFLARAYTILGRFEDAKQAANELAAFYIPHFKHMPELEYYASAPLTVLITFDRWKDILNLPKPSEDMHMSIALWRFGRAMAMASLGDVSQAINEQQAFWEEKKKLPEGEVFGYNKAAQILLIADHCLKSRIAEAQGNYSQAVEFLQKAVAEQDSLHYNEPPDWFFPVRERLGSLLLRMQKPIEAEQVFRDDLKRHPRNGRSLFGLKESLKAQSKFHDLYWVNEEFQKAWKHSEMNLIQ